MRTIRNKLGRISIYIIFLYSGLLIYPLLGKAVHWIDHIIDETLSLHAHNHGHHHANETAHHKKHDHEHSSWINTMLAGKHFIDIPEAIPGHTHLEYHFTLTDHMKKFYLHPDSQNTSTKCKYFVLKERLTDQFNLPPLTPPPRLS